MGPGSYPERTIGGIGAHATHTHMQSFLSHVAYIRPGSVLRHVLSDRDVLTMLVLAFCLAIGVAGVWWMNRQRGIGNKTGTT